MPGPRSWFLRTKSNWRSHDPCVQSASKFTELKDDYLLFMENFTKMSISSEFLLLSGTFYFFILIFTYMIIRFDSVYLKKCIHVVLALQSLPCLVAKGYWLLKLPPPFFCNLYLLQSLWILLFMFLFLNNTSARSRSTVAVTLTDKSVWGWHGSYFQVKDSSIVVLALSIHRCLVLKIQRIFFKHLNVCDFYIAS